MAWKSSRGIVMSLVVALVVLALAIYGGLLWWKARPRVMRIVRMAKS